MIELSGLQLRTLREVISRCLAPLPRSRTTPICLEAGPSGLVVRTKNEYTAVEWRQPGNFPSERLVVTLDALKRSSSRRDSVIRFEASSADSAVVRWTEKQIPQTIECSCVEFPGDFPEAPDSTTENGPELFAALAAAEKVVDTGASRYALQCCELHGKEGRIAATDGRQGLVQHGFAFPWEAALLVRASSVFACDVFAGRSIQVGRSGDWIAFVCGDWTVYLAIEKDARFPDVTNILPASGSEVATLHLANEDAAFLQEAVTRLPGSDADFSPVTVDLNGHVTLCARDGATDRSMAVELSNSRRSGEMLRLSTNRHYLSQAARLGFREICFPGNEGVAWCRDARRTYVWMSLAKELAIKPENCTERIASPLSTASIKASSKALNRSISPVQAAVNTTTNSHTEGESSMKRLREKSPEPPDPSPSMRSSTLLSQVDGLRSTLAEALGQARELASALRRRQKQSRLVESTLASLRQLKEVEV